MAYKMGKDGSVVVGSTTLCVKSWKAKDQTEKVDVTNTCSGGKREVQGSISHVEFTIEADWDETTHPFVNPPNIKSGETVAIELYIDVNDSPTFDIPTAFIESVDVDLSVEGVVKYTLSGQSSGTYTLNG